MPHRVLDGLCRRVVVPAWPVLDWTRSQTWLTSQRPLPPISSSEGARCLASGSAIRPVSATWQMISSLVRQVCTVPPPSVWQGVAGELADSEHQVGDARRREPGTLGPAGDQAAHRAQVITVAQCLGVRGRAGQRPITSRRQVGRPQVPGAGCLLPVLDEGRVRACRIGKDRSGKPRAVVGADEGNRAVAEGPIARAPHALLPFASPRPCGRARPARRCNIRAGPDADRHMSGPPG